jgi:peptidyl-prolyl cis-trans isomerase C
MKHTLIRTVPDGSQADAFSGCSHGPIPAARRAATAPPIFVNGVAIAETAIAQEAQNHDAASGPEARAAAARALTIRELLLQRARALNLTATPERDAAGQEETAEEALVRCVLEAEAPAPEPNEAECRRFYAVARARFTAPELYEASHILFAPVGEGAAAWAMAHERAANTINAIAAGGDFSILAHTYSACSTAAEGGALGHLQAGDLAPEIEQALFALAEGSIGAKPVRTRHGWHVIRLDRCATAEPPPFEAVAPAIREALRARAWATSSARYVAELAGAARIEGLSLSLGTLL